MGKTTDKRVSSMSEFNIAGWDSNYVVLQLKTTQSPILETKLVEVSSAMAEKGYNRYHDFKRAVFRVSNAGQMEPVVENTLCFTNPSTQNCIVISGDKVEIVSLHFDDFDALSAEFDDVKKVLSPILSFMQVVGIFHRVIYSIRCDDFPTDKLKAEYLGTLAPRNPEHFHSEYKYWEDTDNADTPGRLSIHVKGAKRHAAFADGIERLTQHIMKLRYDEYADYSGGYSLDVYEKSDDFNAVEMDQPMASKFIELHERMKSLALEVTSGR